MKKLTILLLLFTIFIFNGINPKEAKAVEYNQIDFVCDNTYTNETEIVGTLEFGLAATEVLIKIPEYIHTVRDNGRYIFDFIFYDNLGNIVSGFQTADVFGNQMNGVTSYFISFEALNIDPTAVSLTMHIPFAYLEGCSNVQEVYFNDFSASEVRYEELSEGSFYWLYDDPINRLRTMKTVIPAGTIDLSLDMGSPVEPYNYITFYNNLGDVLETFYLSYPSSTINYGWNTPYDSPTPYEYIIDLTVFDFYAEIYSFDLIVGNENYTHAANEINYLNHSSYYAFDSPNLLTINYIVEDVIVREKLGFIGFKPPSYDFPTQPAYDYQFLYWVTADLVEYKFTPITSDMVQGNEVNLYAIWEIRPPDVDIPVDTPIADENNTFTVAMTKLGFNDPIERTLVFGFVALFTAFLLMWKGVSSFAIIIVIGLELAFFMYLGVLPLFAFILILLALILVGLKYSGGAANEI